ncbi:hypothetical protein ACLBTQ_06855, partial [Pseudomonas aeruginosa]
MDAESLEMLARSSCTAHPQSFGGAPAESSCKHEHSHIVDSKTHGGGYAGPVSRRIFCQMFFPYEGPGFRPGLSY